MAKPGWQNASFPASWSTLPPTSRLCALGPYIRGVSNSFGHQKATEPLKGASSKYCLSACPLFTGESPADFHLTIIFRAFRTPTHKR